MFGDLRHFIQPEPIKSRGGSMKASKGSSSLTSVSETPAKPQDKDHTLSLDRLTLIEAINPKVLDVSDTQGQKQDQDHSRSLDKVTL